MKNGKKPDPNVIHPIAGYDKEIYVKPIVKNPNIIVGDFTYIADSEFESHVTNYYPWSRDKLIIGKFWGVILIPTPLWWEIPQRFYGNDLMMN